MYELLNLALQPFVLLFAGLIAGVVWLWRAKEGSQRRALVFTSVMLALLYACSTSLAGYFAMRSLEAWYPPSGPVASAEDVIVVLGGAQHLEDVAGSEVRPAEDTLYRCLHAAKIYRRSGGCRLVLSGGKVDSAVPGPTVAEGMRRLLVELGIPERDLVLESQSTTTYENAVFTRQLLVEQPAERVLLVTDAASMLRAVKCFAKQDIEVEPAPCDHRAAGLDISLALLLPSQHGIAGVNDAAHEWLGLAWYWLRGRI